MSGGKERKGGEPALAWVRVKALTLNLAPSEVDLRLKSWQNAWGKQTASCEHTRARQVQREARSSFLKSCPTSESPGSLLPHCQNAPGDNTTCWASASPWLQLVLAVSISLRGTGDGRCLLLPPALPSPGNGRSCPCQLHTQRGAGGGHGLLPRGSIGLGKSLSFPSQPDKCQCRFQLRCVPAHPARRLPVAQSVPTQGTPRLGTATFSCLLSTENRFAIPPSSFL